MRARRLWPADGDGCKSCPTIHRFHKCHGYCTRCYPIIYRISRIDRGLYQPRRRPSHASFSTIGIRKNAVNELEEIREFEAPLRNGATGVDIENLQISMAERIRARPETFQGVRYFFDGALDNSQRTRTYQIIAQLVESMPSRRFVQASFVKKQRDARESAEFDARLRAADTIRVGYVP
jgi:hypothetical protein